MNPTCFLGTAVAITIAATPVATAGVYGRLGTGPSTHTRTDCSRLTPTRERIPAWSRLQWSVGLGSSSRRVDGEWDTSFAIVPQASVALWAREGQCEPGGSWLFRSRAWRRWSLGVSADLAWRTADVDATDARPALRLARATYESGLLSFGSTWVPSTEVSLTAGPTFDPAWSGGAVSLGARASILSLELRLAARSASRGQEIMLLVGLTDVHGLWSIGSDRTWNID